MTEDSGDHAWNDRKSWVPPPDQEYQDAHGWRDGKPPGSTDTPEPGRILTGAEFIGRHVPPVWLLPHPQWMRVAAGNAQATHQQP